MILLNQPVEILNISKLLEYHFNVIQSNLTKLSMLTHFTIKVRHLKPLIPTIVEKVNLKKGQNNVHRCYVFLFIFLFVVV